MQAKVHHADAEMIKRDIRKLQRIVQVTALLYRQRIVEVAEARARCAELAAAASRVAQLIDDPLGDGARLQEFALLRAARLRQDLASANRELANGLETAGAALVTLKGAERVLRAMQSNADREAAERALNEILERPLRRSGSLDPLR